MCRETSEARLYDGEMECLFVKQDVCSVGGISRGEEKSLSVVESNQCR